MNQKVMFFIGTFLISLFFSGCYNDENENNTFLDHLGKTVPITVKVEIPSSIKKTSSQATDQDSASAIYKMLSDITSSFDYDSKEILCYMVYIGTVWNDIQDKVESKGEGIEIEFKKGELTYKLTQEMKNYIIKNNRNYVAINGEAALELGKVGEESEMPAITFNQLKDGDESGYKYSVSFNKTEIFKNETISYKYTIKWSKNTKKVFANLAFTGTLSDSTMSSPIIFNGFNRIIFHKGSNNDDSMTAIMNMDMGTSGKMTRIFNVKQDSAKIEKTGILFTIKDFSQMVIGGQLMLSDISIKGKADDNGGFIKVFAQVPAMPAMPSTVQMKENWDPKGTLLGSSYSTDGKTWTASSGYAAPSGEYVMDDSQMSAMSDSVGAGTKVKLKAGASIVATTSDMAYLDKSYQIFPTGVIPSSETMDRTIGYAYYDYTSDYSSLVLKIDFWGPSTLIPSAVLYSVTGFDANQFPIFGTGTANVLE